MLHIIFLPSVHKKTHLLADELNLDHWIGKPMLSNLSYPAPADQAIEVAYIIFLESFNARKLISMQANNYSSLYIAFKKVHST